MKNYFLILIMTLGFSLTNCTNMSEEPQANSTSEDKMQKFIESEEYIALQKEMQSFGLHIKKQFVTLTSQKQDRLLELLNMLKDDDIDAAQVTDIQKEINELLKIDFAKEVARLETLGSNVRLYAQKNKLSHKELTIASNKSITFPRLRNNSESGDTTACVAACSAACAACIALIGTPSGGTGAAFCAATYAACLLTC